MTAVTDREHPRVLGSVVDEHTRCAHYRGELDVIAMRFKCCAEYYPCFECHAEAAGHPAARWSEDDLDRPAVLCGVCRRELAIRAYLAVSGCPHCGAGFNPRCSLHHHLYFDFEHPSRTAHPDQTDRPAPATPPAAAPMENRP